MTAVETASRPLEAPLSTFSRSVLLGALVGVVTGCASALFLAALDVATELRTSHESIVYCLPLAGLLIGWCYDRFGKAVQGGNDRVLDTFHDEGPPLPLRMAPLVLVGTVLTHAFGGSAGREGTAVQMGASLAEGISQRLRLGPELRRRLLVAGVAGGFGSVFGTPFAGAVFAFEFVAGGRAVYAAIVPALVAALVGDWTTTAWGIEHTPYPAPPSVALDGLLLGKWLVFASAVALVTVAFIELTRGLKASAKRYLEPFSLRLMIGGALVVVLWQGVGTSDYLGLGIPTILRAFEDPNLPANAFALKLLFTAVTLGAGFLGGEVTPLFFIGATLGSVLARLLGIPLELGAGVGLAAVFASASNAPLALSVMAVELLGGNVLPHVAIVCTVGYMLTGQRSIYSAQRVLGQKGRLQRRALVHLGLRREPRLERSLAGAESQHSTEPPDEPRR